MNRMHKLFLLLHLIYVSTCNAKIYDCFLFFNELELLELRLQTLYNHVDKFVLVESRETFRGNLKPFYFEENKHRFEPFLDKIIHVIVNERMETNYAWDRDIYQRDQIMRGLIDCQPDDLILISDADEIIRPSVIPEIQRKLEQISSQPGHHVVLCNQAMYRYYMNRFDVNGFPWPGSVGVFYKDLTISPNSARALAQQRLVPGIDNAGWHFTYMGGYERVVKKMTSWAHAECDTPENKDRKNIEKKIASFPLVPIDETYPEYVYNNLEKYIKYGFIDVSDFKQ